MRARAGRRIVGQHPAHPAQQPFGIEADRVEHRQEQIILFETITTAAPTDQLGVHRGGADIDPYARQCVDRLERDGIDMGRLERGEHIERWRDRTTIAPRAR